MNLIEAMYEATCIFEEAKDAIRYNARSLREVELYMDIIQDTYNDMCKLFERETQDLREIFENDGKVAAGGEGWDKMKEVYLSKIEEFSTQNKEKE